MTYSFLLFSTGVLAVPMGILAVFSGVDPTWLLLLFSYPHFAFSFSVLWDSHASKGKKFFWALVVPLALFWGLWLLSRLSGEVTSLLVQLLYLYLLWHFAKQSYGVSLWFQKNDSLGGGFKKATHIMNLMLAIYAYVISQRGPATLVLFKTYSPSIYWKDEIVIAVTTCTGLALVAWALYYGRKLIDRFSRPRILALIPTINLFLIFSLIFVDSRFTLIAVLMHGMQYYPFSLSTIRSSWKKITAIIFASIFIFFIPYSTFLNQKEHLISLLFMTMNLHHFMLDSFLWKSKNSDFIQKGYMLSSKT